MIQQWTSSLLISNYLEDPALLLFKSVKDISEIWD